MGVPSRPTTNQKYKELKVEQSNLNLVGSMSKKQETDENLDLIRRVDKEYKDSGVNSFFNYKFGFLNAFMIIVIVNFESYFFYFFRSEPAQTVMADFRLFWQFSFLFQRSRLLFKHSQIGLKKVFK